jgi:small subunit ribosomal protein S16
MGKHKRPFYRVVAVDSRSPRDGRYLDLLGTYDPMAEPVMIQIDETKALQWLKRGARVSDTVKSLFQKKGILRQASVLEKS